MTTEYLLDELAEKNTEIAELKRQLTIRDELLCQTCHGAGTVLISIDDGMDCPECVERDNNIKADAVMEVANNWIINKDGDYPVRTKLIDIANKLRGEAK